MHPKLHPWILPPQLRLAPRGDAWFAFAVSSCTAVVSVGHIKQGIREEDDYSRGFCAWGDYDLSACAISFGLAFGIAAVMRCVFYLICNIYPL